MYCEKCKHLVTESPCPNCENKTLREPKGDDLCFLTQTDDLFVNVMMDVLSQNNIPAYRKTATETALNIMMGQSYVRNNIYVPFAFYSDAKETADAFMHADAETVTILEDAEKE